MTARRVLPVALLLALLGLALALAPGPLWGYLLRLGLALGAFAAVGALLAGLARPSVRRLTDRPEAGDFVELEATWLALWPGFWRIEVEDGARCRRHEAGFRVGRAHLRWAEEGVPRGLHRYLVRLHYRDPLGLMGRRGADAAELYVSVHPKAVQLAAGTLRRVGRRHAAGRQHLPEAREYAGVRRYEPGERLSRLHWPQTLRTGELQVRETVRGGGRVRQIVLDVDARDYPDPELFELAVSVAASFALSLTQGGGRLGLAAGRFSVRAERGHPLRLIEALTAARPDERAGGARGDAGTLFVGPAAAARAFKAACPGALAVAVGPAAGGADVSIATYPQLWRLGRRLRS